MFDSVSGPHSHSLNTMKSLDIILNHFVFHKGLEQHKGEKMITEF